MPLISVVIPVYNNARSLRTSLPSLFRQVFKDFEVIVIDEGSTDGSLELLNHHEEAGRLRLIHSRHIIGPLGAWNSGAQSAVGDWLIVFHPQDLLLFDHLSRIAEAMTRHPAIDLFLCAYQRLTGKQVVAKAITRPQGVLNRRQALEAYAHDDFIHHHTACLRRERFMAMGGFPREYAYGAEEFFWLKVLCELEQVHCDATVTSLWQAVDDRPAPQDPLPLHPALDLVTPYSQRLTRRERRQLLAAVNRKLLEWGLENLRQGHPVQPTLSALRLAGMSPHLWPNLRRLLLP